MANWIEIKRFQSMPKVLDAPWLMVTDVLEHVDHLRITADGAWKLFPGQDLMCGPNGFGGFAIADAALILPGCPFGALIGKFGGSSASLDAPSAAAGAAAPTGGAFAIGSHCIVARPAATHGPLFIAFNTRVRPVDVEKFEITIEATTLGLL